MRAPRPVTIVSQVISLPIVGVGSRLTIASVRRINMSGPSRCTPPQLPQRMAGPIELDVVFGKLGADCFVFRCQSFLARGERLNQNQADKIPPIRFCQMMRIAAPCRHGLSDIE